MVEPSNYLNPSMSSAEKHPRFPPGEDFTTKIEPFFKDALYQMCNDAKENPDKENGCSKTLFSLNECEFFKDTRVIWGNNKKEDPVDSKDFKYELQGETIKAYMELSCRKCRNQWGSTYGQLRLLFDKYNIGIRGGGNYTIKYRVIAYSF